MKTPKLSSAQGKVMHWMSQGWSACVAHGAAVKINGKRMCNLEPMTVLERHGLIERDRHSHHWKATEAGRRLSPNYRAPEAALPLQEPVQ